MHTAAAASRESLFWAVCSSAGTRASNWIMRPLAEVCLGEVSLPLLPHPLLGRPSPLAPTAPMIFKSRSSKRGKTIRRASTKCLNPASHPGLALTVCEVCALSDLDNISVRIADVAANLAVLGNRLRDELGPSTLP